MASRPHHSGAPESIGALLARLRLARGLSQLRVAERLCAAAGLPTVSRHEVSRWEREERIPGPFWLTWLATVLEAPLAELEAAVANTRGAERGTAAARPRVPGHPRLWQPPTPAELLAELDHAPDDDIRELAHAWLAIPPGAPEPPTELVIPPAGAGTDPQPSLAALETRLGELRRMDDLVGGVDLAPYAVRELRAAVDALRTVGRVAGGTGRRRRALRLVAEYAQLTGWVYADAGQPAAARRAYRVGLRAAVAAGDRPLAAHVLGALSHLSLATQRREEALLLARTAQAGAATCASALTQALLLQRVALAAAHAGERRAAHAALAASDRAADRADPRHEPSWLYWLDQAELSAMTGRCLAVLGRPLRAARLLAPGRAGTGPRTAALYGGYLAGCYLELGEIEQACRVARRALRDAVRAGSVRAAAGLRHLRPRLLRHRDLPAVRGFEQVSALATGYLPAPERPEPDTVAV